MQFSEKIQNDNTKMVIFYLSRIQKKIRKHEYALFIKKDNCYDHNIQGVSDEILHGLLEIECWCKLQCCSK